MIESIVGTLLGIIVAIGIIIAPQRTAAFGIWVLVFVVASNI